LETKTSANRPDVIILRKRYDHLDEGAKIALLESIPKEEKTFQQAAFELLVTERDYFVDLKIMNDVREATPLPLPFPSNSESCAGLQRAPIGTSNPAPA